MKREKMKSVSLILLAFGLLCFRVNAQPSAPSDKMASTETVNLFRNLIKLQQKNKYLIGHQDALAYGVKWKYQPGRSDVKDVTGDYPALYGWELGHLEVGSTVNLDSVPFDKMRGFIRDGYKRGGVITISWHGNNPMTGKTAWDPEPGTVTSILPGGNKHDVFRKQLDKVAAFLLSLKGARGEYIPVLFRPFHEHTGGWFWWGIKTTSDSEYQKLFRFTVEYLRDVKGLHHLLYVYNTASGFKNREEFLKRYPGDEFVDVLSFDAYQFSNQSADFSTALKADLGVVEDLAIARNKIAAVAETGYSKIPDAKWWTGTVAPAFRGRQFAFVLFWRNAGHKKDKTTEYYVPYKGQPSEIDFIRFYNLPETVFQKELGAMKIYR